MSSSSTDRLYLNAEEAAFLYVRLKRDEGGIEVAERNLLRKLESFLYGFLSIEELERMVGDGKGGHR